MKLLYLDCGMGAAGDMLTAALLELLDDPAAFVAEVNGWGLPGVVMELHRAEKCGIQGSHVSVRVCGEEEQSVDVPPDGGQDHSHDHNHEHSHDNHAHSHEHEHAHDHPHDHGEAHTHSHGHSHDHPHCHSHEHAHDHTHDHGHDHHHHEDNHEHYHGHTHEAGHHSHGTLGDIAAIIEGLPVSPRVKADAQAVYRLIADAEAKVHGRPASQVHFHEVGALDAVADVAAVCALLERIAPDRVVASPVHVGSGKVRCAHGVLPVPAPATALILQGVPSYGGEIRGELCTPTGAALLKHFADAFGPQPMMATEKIGYGMGTKDFPAANCLRALLGEAGGGADEVVQLACNLDDATGEELGYALEKLLAEGALDAFVLPIQMKKSRPGQMLVCLCAAQDEEKMAALLFRHTPTLGLRSQRLSRRVLEREAREAQTPFGPVRIKSASGYGVSRKKPEYEDIARIAEEQGFSLAEVKRRLASREE